MNQRALAQFYQEIIEDKLDLKTSLDESGHVVCKLPDLGCLIVCLDEDDPEYFMLAMGFSDEEILSLPPQQLLEAVNHVNATSKAAKLSVEFCSDTGEPNALKATVECFLAR